MESTKHISRIVITAPVHKGKFREKNNQQSFREFPGQNTKTSKSWDIFPGNKNSGPFQDFWNFKDMWIPCEISLEYIFQELYSLIIE